MSLLKKLLVSYKDPNALNPKVLEQETQRSPKEESRVGGGLSCRRCLCFLALEPQTDHAESSEIMADHAKSCP